MVSTCGMDYGAQMSLLSQRESIDLQFTNIVYCVPNGWKKGQKNILKGISGAFRSGQISAILGPSGAGKTTLMNIVSGFRTKKASGEILVNGKPRCLKSFRKVSRYIMEDDHHLQYLTVQESMQAAASLKLGNNLSNSEKDILIGEILTTLNLEKTKNTRVSNISGGEKKRLSIALELINNPSIMFFDEPTRGLDSVNAYQCINLLKKLAEGGRTIVCSIHQPSASLFERFDYLLAVAEGHCIYRGTIPDLIPFMSSLAIECPSYHNPADFLIEVSSGQYGNYITQMVEATDRKIDTGSSIIKISKTVDKEKLTKNKSTYELSHEANLDITECEHKFSTNHEDITHSSVNFWTQFYVLLIRNLRLKIRDPALTLLQFMAHLVLGIFLGLVYFQIGNEASLIQSNVSFLFVSNVIFSITSSMTAILTFSLEMKAYIREHFNRWYSLKAFYFARLVSDVPFQLALIILFICVTYFMTNQPREVSRFLLMSAITTLTVFITQSIGITVGAMTNAQKTVYAVVMILLPNAIFSGFIATFSSIPAYLRWMTYVSFYRYVYEGSMKATYGNNREQLHCSEAFCVFKYPKKIMEHFEVEDGGIWIDIIVLAAFAVGIKIIGYFLFRRIFENGR